ncbi:hypothetical protein [Ammoniphilus resinae]|uniref:Ribosomal protein L11 n=1 Tax=Ammoniphilus resinae TaxID=861532 RepID=A0ABS4GRH9_9BACL|nr:hypothetical protein [Ammoniphilus resinae]MBP1932856.1 ribosomal protein L11 [Ammoniphilus resinae]
MKGKFFTAISLLKKVFKPGERSLSRGEITHRLVSFFEEEHEEGEKLIQAALNAEKTPFREGNSRAIIEYKQEPHAIASHVYKILNDAKVPLTEETILRRLRSLSLISWNFSFDRLGLITDSRFSQVELDKRWVLSDWEPVNDQVYQYFMNQGIGELPMREIPLLIQMKLNVPKNKCLFFPELDERFFAEDEVLYLVGQPGEEPHFTDSENNSAALQEQTKQSYQEVASAVETRVVEERTADNSKTVVDQVLEDLLGGLIKLEKRSGEMKEEVLTYFTSNDIEAIGTLMKEKERNEKVLEKLKEIIDELS